jgi:diguanylate cyclase (GGDEF)-like protein/PAS domain S-box-containing protein
MSVDAISCYAFVVTLGFAIFLLRSRFKCLKVRLALTRFRKDHLHGVRYLSDEMTDIIGAAKTDISKQRQLQDNMHLALKVFAHAHENVAVTDSEMKILWVNEAFCSTTGYAADEVLGEDLGAWLQADLCETLNLAEALINSEDKGCLRFEVQSTRKSGEKFEQSVTLTRIYANDGAVKNHVFLSCDVTRQKEHEKKLRQVSDYDPLTGLPNSETLKRFLSQCILKAYNSEFYVAVCSIDLDNFKQINDEYGQNVGDAFLRETAIRIQAHLGPADLVARIGGDEFVVVFGCLDEKEDYLKQADLIQRAVSEPFIWDRHQISTSCSMGVTLYPQHGEHNGGHLLRQADHAMYQAKLQGGSSVYLFNIDRQKNQLDHNRKLEQISRGLQGGEFCLYYQPKVNMRSEDIIGAEALIRWNHPEKGLLAPASFLPDIEQHPLDVELGRWVIDSALKQIQSWHEDGIHLPVSVNVSGYHLQQKSFVDELKQMLHKYPHVQKSDLEIEVLETSAIEDLEHVSRIIQECRAIGVNIALDDFGTGYSSLSYLKHLPVQVLKIDQTFVRGMLESPDDLSILEGIIGMARAFRRQVIAEGVETVEHGQMLLQLGCEWAQGYVIGRPMPAHDVPAWMKNWKADASWLKTRPLSRPEMKGIRICVSHRAWCKQVLLFAQRKSKNRPEMDEDNCELGRWLKNPSVRASQEPHFLDELEQLHRLTHEIGRDLLHNRDKHEYFLPAAHQLNELVDKNERMVGTFLNKIVTTQLNPRP